MYRAFPFLDPDRLQQLLAAMPEGRSVAFAKLAKIHSKLVDAIIQRAVDEKLRPYFEALRGKSLADSIMAGYKFIRDDEAGDDGDEEGAAEAPAREKGEVPLFFWFFFPLVRGDGRHSGLAAWEASTGSGRATYFFRRDNPASQRSMSKARWIGLPRDLRW